MASKTLFAAVVLSSAVVVAEPLVGPTVGNADALVAEATKLYNQKAYPKASELFLEFEDGFFKFERCDLHAVGKSVKRGRRLRIFLVCENGAERRGG